MGWEGGREPCLRSLSCLRNLSFQSFCQFLMLLRVGTKEGGLFCLKHTGTFPSLSRSRPQCQEKYKKIYIRNEIWVLEVGGERREGSLREVKAKEMGASRRQGAEFGGHSLEHIPDRAGWLTTFLCCDAACHPLPALPQTFADVHPTSWPCERKKEWGQCSAWLRAS